ncbi:MAG: hypothetical protein NTU80_12950 [Verrucomicrobia bacterium]|nr:hypothetical protein [Verrucomicrobiota bacterium]
MSSVKIGLFAIGLDTYWPQFAGLEARLRSYVETVAGSLARPGAEIIKLGPIDNPEKAQAAGYILETGNTPIHHRFPIGAQRFVNDWNSDAPAHLYTEWGGHIVPKLEKLAALLGMERRRVCRTKTTIATTDNL